MIDFSMYSYSKVSGLCQVHYCIYQYEPLLDSCNMAPKNWLDIANDIYVSLTAVVFISIFNYIILSARCIFRVNQFERIAI